MSKLEFSLDILNRNGRPDALVGDAECLKITLLSSSTVFLESKGVRDLKLIEDLRLLALLVETGLSLQTDLSDSLITPKLANMLASRDFL